jgi:hypothetical protein
MHVKSTPLKDILGGLREATPDKDRILETIFSSQKVKDRLGEITTKTTIGNA